MTFYEKILWISSLHISAEFSKYNTLIFFEFFLFNLGHMDQYRNNHYEFVYHTFSEENKIKISAIAPGSTVSTNVQVFTNDLSNIT